MHSDTYYYVEYISNDTWYAYWHHDNIFEDIPVRIFHDQNEALTWANNQNEKRAS